VLNKQHKRALSKQLVINLVMLFTYDIKTAFIYSKEITMFTLNIQGTFDAVLKKQLFKRITKQS
jgi:hypothetical protein